MNALTKWLAKWVAAGGTHGTYPPEGILDTMPVWEQWLWILAGAAVLVLILRWYHASEQRRIATRTTATDAALRRRLAEMQQAERYQQW